MGPLLAAVLFAAAPEPRAALILGGGTTRPAAERWLATWPKLAAPFEGFHTLAPGYPRIVESAKVPGLKPGFHVVLLGVCRLGDVAPRIAYLKSIHAGIYMRKVRLPEEACPTVAAKVGVVHTQSLDAKDATLTLSQVSTPRGVLLRATLLSKGGELLDTEGFDTPRAGAGTCFGGFALDRGTFEVTLCQSSRETNICCASRRVSRLAVADGKLDRNAPEPPAPAAAPEPADAGAAEAFEPSCSVASLLKGSFTRKGADELVVLEICEVGEFEYGGGGGSSGLTIHSREARLRVEHEGKVLASTQLAEWSQGWEWGTRLELTATLPLGKTGRDGVVLHREDFDEHSGVGTVSVYDGELRELWTRGANSVDATVSGSTLEVTAETRVNDDPMDDSPPETEHFTVSWRNGALVEKKR